MVTFLNILRLNIFSPMDFIVNTATNSVLVRMLLHLMFLEIIDDEIEVQLCLIVVL